MKVDSIVEVGDLVTICNSLSFGSEWIKKAQKNNTPLLVVGVRKEESELYSLFKILFEGETMWVYINAIKILKKGL